VDGLATHPKGYIIDVDLTVSAVYPATRKVDFLRIVERT
jgi:hypothetical protein